MDETLNQPPEDSNTDKILEMMLQDSSQKGDEALRIAEAGLQATGQTTDAVRSLEPVLESSLQVQAGIKDALEKKAEPIQSLEDADEEMPQVIFRGLRGKPGKDGKDGETPTDEKLLALIRPLIPKPERGAQGPKGDTGDAAVPPSDEELLALIKPLIPAPIPGHTPTDEELTALIKPLIPKPKAIKGDKGDPGSPDTGEDIIKKLLAVEGDPLSTLVNHLGIPAFKRGGGAGYLRELSDVDLTDIADGYVLAWNSTTGKFSFVAQGGSGGGAAWGDITGTLSNQTDLQAALDAKADLAGATFTGAVEVPDEAYGAGWNSSTEVPTKNAIYDKIETIASGGITRSVTVTSGSATMGSDASTDYVYLVAGAHTMTLPTAVSNTNRYTVKNKHSANITIDTTSAQTIDGDTSISVPPGSSVDLISDGSNWNII